MDPAGGWDDGMIVGYAVDCYLTLVILDTDRGGSVVIHKKVLFDLLHGGGRRSVINQVNTTVTIFLGDKILESGGEDGRP